jgi:hypothetical protein
MSCLASCEAPSQTLRDWKCFGSRCRRREMRAAGIGRLTGARCRRLWFGQNRPSHYWPLGVRRSIADFAIEGLTKLHAHDLEARCDSFDVKIIGTLFRP